jgi:type IV pilus assembly protein PilV
MPINTSIAGRKPSVNKQRGDTMIEVLVTVIIIATGVLGAAALQITTLKNLSVSHSNSIAAILIEDLGERMRANPTAALADNYVTKLRAPTSFSNCAATTCTPAELAQYDLGTWWIQLEALLPRGNAWIARIPGTNTFDLRVFWDADRSGAKWYFACPGWEEDDFNCFQYEITI